MQTNEVQRCWGLLPGFLSVADERPIDLIELGPSGGLNLYWDRYRYRYGGHVWGPAAARLELNRQVKGGPTTDVLEVSVTVLGVSALTGARSTSPATAAPMSSRRSSGPTRLTASRACRRRSR